MLKFLIDIIQLCIAIKIVSFVLRIVWRRIFGKKSKKKNAVNKIFTLVSLKLHRQIDKKLYAEKQRKPVAIKQQANNVVAIKSYKRTTAK